MHWFFWTIDLNAENKAYTLPDAHRHHTHTYTPPYPPTTTHIITISNICLFIASCLCLSYFCPSVHCFLLHFILVVVSFFFSLSYDVIPTHALEKIVSPPYSISLPLKLLYFFSPIFSSAISSKMSTYTLDFIAPFFFCSSLFFTFWFSEYFFFFFPGRWYLACFV